MCPYAKAQHPVRRHTGEITILHVFSHYSRARSEYLESKLTACICPKHLLLGHSAAVTMRCSQGLVTGAVLYGAAYVLDAVSHLTGVHQLAPSQGLAVPRNQRVGAVHTNQSLPTRRICQGNNYECESEVRACRRCSPVSSPKGPKQGYSRIFCLHAQTSQPQEHMPVQATTYAV